ncbi:MAG: hypothetical protein RL591_2064, partial [Planctomycetota bacterium]
MSPGEDHTEPTEFASDDIGFPRAPLPISRPRADHFPTTQLTTLLSELRTLHGDDAHMRLAETIMRRYAEPLAIYARGSTLREIAEPDELVHGYFAYALADATFLDRYLASGMRLRRWLMNGLLLHARSVIRDRSRARRREGAPLEIAPPSTITATLESNA